MIDRLRISAIDQWLTTRRSIRSRRAVSWRISLAAIFLTSGFAALAFGTVPMSRAAHAAVEASKAAPVAASPTRHALVVGVGKYGTVSVPTAVASARAMARKLEELGFQVDFTENATAAGMHRMLATLGDRAGTGNVVLFYFAGHSLRQHGEKLLLPADADVGASGDMANRAISLESVLHTLRQGRGDGAKLVVLDTSLYPTKGATRGLRVQSAPSKPLPNVLIAESNGLTSPSGAPDGVSVYTGALLAALDKAGQSVDGVFRTVTSTVREAHQEAPEPTHTSTLTGPVQLVAPEGGARAGRSAGFDRESSIVRRGIRLTEQEAPQARLDGPPPRGGETAQAAGTSSEFETALWKVIQGSKNPADFEAYLEVFPSGQYAAQARQKLAVLRGPAAPKAPPAPKVDAIRGEYVLTATANIRELPDTDAPVVARGEKGATVQVTGRVVDANWYRVNIGGGRSAYVASSLLREVTKAPAASPSKKPQVAVAPPRMPPPTDGKSFRDCPTCPEMVPLPAGTFRMGNDKGDISERPAHTVRIAKPFAIGKFEVTAVEWKTCAAAGGCSYKPRMKNASDRTPVHRLSWKDIQEYLAWLKQTTGKAYRLPSEAEWEYAARGGTSGRFWWGDRMAVGMADCKECGGNWNYALPAPVDASRPNPFGLYGMSGGVWEWTDDCWRPDYDGAPSDGSASSKGNCSVRVLRGGSWRNDHRYAHVSSRLRYDYNVRYSTNGFRVVRDLP